MARYSSDTIQEIKDRVSILDVVRNAVGKIQRKGNNWWACCPFHQEKTPSFSVREDEGFYHCFGCGAHGDVFTFVQETRGGTFNDAIAYLAGLAGVTLKEETVDPKQEARRNNGYAALLAAQKCPEDYKDLLVRMAGYSDYFNDMNADLQQEVIDRTQNENL